MDTELKFGSETEVTHSADGHVTESIKVEKHNGGEVRRLKIREESIKIDDKKTVLNSVLAAYGQHERGEILGWSVNAEHYKPKSLIVERIIVRTVKFATKG